METLPERPDPIKSFLSWLDMSDEDVARYSDLSYVLETIKKGELCWQAAASVGVHALVFGVLGETDNQKALAESLAGHALQQMEAVYEYLIQQARQKTLTDEQARMLFHVRVGLGFLLAARGEREAAKRFLHDMAATRLSRHAGGYAYREGGDVVKYSEDMGRAKDLTAYVMCDVYAETEDYEEALHLIAEAADTTGDRLELIPRAIDLLDRWAAKCPAALEPTWDLPEFMFDLLESAGRVLSVCQTADASGALPGDCEQGSAQFLAYKLGQLAARFATRDVYLWHAVLSDFESPNAVYLLVESLLSDCDPQRDWQRAREAYIKGWQLTPCYQGIPAEEIGPHTDLYWAMRIGFADEMLKSTQALVPAESPPTFPDLASRMQAIQDTVTATNLRLIKQQREDDRRRLPTEEELCLFLKERLGTAWDNLPSDVTDALVSAEYGYRAGWQSAIPTRAVLKGFHEAVEACFEWYFSRPFAAYLKERGLLHATVCWGVWRGQPERSPFEAGDPRCLSLGRWAGAFKAVTNAGFSANENVEVKAFLKHNWPDLGVDALRQLAASMRRVQDLRNRGEHPHSPPRPHHTERSETKEMRKLVLDPDGDGSSSIIARICRLFGPGERP
jgi:hypothetical protein